MDRPLSSSLVWTSLFVKRSVSRFGLLFRGFFHDDFVGFFCDDFLGYFGDVILD